MNEKDKTEIYDVQPKSNNLFSTLLLYRESTYGRWFSVLLGLIIVFLCSGIMFGWGSISVILEKEGAYHNYCYGNYNIDDICENQITRLSIIFTISTFFFALAAIPGGIFLDYFGRQWTMLFGLLIVALGSLCYAFGSTTSTHYIDGFQIGTILFFSGGVCLFISGMVLSGIIPDKRGFIVGIANFAFDSSSLMAFILYMFYIIIDSREIVFIVFAVILLFCCFLTPLWKQFSNEIQPTHENQNEIELDDKIYEEEQEISIEIVNDNWNLLSLRACEQIRDNMSTKSTFKEFALSFNFIMILLWLGCHSFFSNFYLGNAVNEIKAMTNDAEESELYSTLYFIILPAGALAGILNGFLLDKFGFIKAFILINSMCVVYLICSIIIYLPLQVLTFVIFASYRPLMYSTCYFYLAYVFPMQYFGKLNAIISALSAITNLLIYPTVLVVYKYLNGSFKAINLLFLIITILSYIFPIVLILQAKIIKNKH